MNLMRRAEELAQSAKLRTIERIAGEVRAMARDVAVEIEDSRIVVSGRRIAKRWLENPALRFLLGGGR